jgi:hypothetical protein
VERCLLRLPQPHSLRTNPASHTHSRK